MKAQRSQVERALRTPGACRFVLLYGPDEAGSRALARLAAAAAGEGGEKIELSGAELRTDPARLADEAASISLFGGGRYIVVDPAGDESVAAVEALLQTPAASNPVVLVGGALKATSKLVKLALAAPDALAFASYVPEGRDAERLAIELGRERGLGIRPELARRLAASCGGNRAILVQELDKLALYADAAPERPRPLEEEAFEAVGAAAEEGDFARLVDSVGGGRPDQVDAELQRLASQGIEGIPVIRAVLRRMTLLSRLRAELERGGSPETVMATHGKSVFFKEKAAVAEQLVRWRPPLIARSIGRLAEAERQAKASGGAGIAAVNETLFAIARQAQRLR